MAYGTSKTNNWMETVTKSMAAASRAVQEAERKKREAAERARQEAEQKKREAEALKARQEVERKKREAAERARLEREARAKASTAQTQPNRIYEVMRPILEPKKDDPLAAMPSPAKPGSSFLPVNTPAKPADKPDVNAFMNMSPRERLDMGIRNMIAQKPQKKAGEKEEEEIGKIVASPFQYLWKKNEADKKPTVKQETVEEKSGQQVREDSEAQQIRAKIDTLNSEKETSGDKGKYISSAGGRRRKYVKSETEKRIDAEIATLEAQLEGRSNDIYFGNLQMEKEGIVKFADDLKKYDTAAYDAYFNEGKESGDNKFVNATKAMPGPDAYMQIANKSMTKDEATRYSALLGYDKKNGTDYAERYFKTLEYDLNARRNDLMKTIYRGMAGGDNALNRVIGGAMDFVSAPASIPALIESGINAADQKINGTYKAPDPNSWTSVPGAMGQEGRDVLLKDTPGWVGNVWDVAKSIGQSTLLAPAGTPVALAVMGGGAGGQAVNEAREAGGTTDQVFTEGITNAAIEAGTELLPMEGLQKAFGGKGNVLKSFLKQGITEAPGEAIAELTENLVNTANMKDKSKFAALTEQYLQENPTATKKEAEQFAALELYVKSPAIAGAVGFGAGGLSGAAASSLGKASARTAYDNAVDDAYVKRGVMEAFNNPITEQAGAGESSNIQIPSRRDAGMLDVTDAGNRVRYEQEIDGVFDGTLSIGTEVIVGRTPELLNLYGAPDLPLHMTQTTARKIAYPEGYQGGKHNLGVDALKQLPEQLSDPVAILTNKSHPNNSVVVITEWNDMGGNRVIVPVEFNKQGAITIQNNVNTAFGRDDMSQYLGKNNENVIYTKNNEDIGELLSHGRQLPEANRSNDVFVDQNVPQNSENVNYSASREKADAIHEALGVEHVYGVNDTLRLENGSEAVVVAKDGGEYVLAQAGRPGYVRADASQITGKVERARTVDRYLAPEKKAYLNEKYDRMHTERMANEKFLREFKEATGVNVEFADLGAGGRIEGMYDKNTDTIYFSNNVTRSDVLKGVAMHEITHAVETSPYYAKYNEFAVQQAFGEDGARVQKAVAEIKSQYAQLGKRLSAQEALNEIAAMYTRDILYKDQADIDALVAGQPGAAARIYDAIKTAIAKLKAYVQKDAAALANIREYQTLERARRLFERALKTRQPGAEMDMNPAYSVNKEFGQQVDDVINGIHPADQDLYIGDTSSVLKGIGFEESPMLMQNSKIKEILNKHPEVSVDTIKKIPQLLEDPVMVIKSKTHGDESVVVVTDVLTDRGYMVLPVWFDQYGHYMTVDVDYTGTANFVASAYGRNMEPLLNYAFGKSGEVLYANKQKSQGLADFHGLQLPAQVSEGGFLNTIHRNAKNVNTGNDKLSIEGMNLTDLDAPGVRSEYIPRQTDADIPAPVREYVPKVGDQNVPPGVPEYIPKVGEGDAPAAMPEYIPHVTDQNAPAGVPEYIPKVGDADAPGATETDTRKTILQNALAEGHEITPAEFRMAHEEYRGTREQFEAVDKELKLTDHQKKVARQIAAGEYDIGKLPASTKKSGVLEWAAAYEQRSNAERVINRYRLNHKRNLRLDAMEAIGGSDLWKDKGSMAYMTETPYRNNIDVMAKNDPEGQKRIEQKYFAPVAEHEAEATRFMQGVNDRVRALDLNKAESVLVQAYGEGLLSDAELETYAKAPFKEIAFANGDESIKKTFLKEQTADAAKVRHAVEEFRAIYDELIELANEARVRNGYAPIEKRANYFPHFNDMTTKDKILGAFGIDISSTDAIPEGIAGITAMFSPGTKFFSGFQRRMGNKTAFDALEGLDGYLRGIKDVIFHTDDIQRLRALESALRSRHADETIRQKIDEINADPMREAEAKSLDIQELLKNTQESDLSNYISWLHEYTNGIAGKKSNLDRVMEQMLSRRAYTVMRKLSGQVASNMIGFNVSSAITNTFALAQAAGQIKTVNLLTGIKNTAKNWVKNDGFVQNSDFLVNRRGVDSLAKDGMQKFSDASAWLMETIDQFTSESIVRAKYAEEIKRGATPEEAMRTANQTAANILADRSYGQMPTAFNAKNPFAKTLTMFQLEVNNQYRNLFKDIPREAKASGGAVALKIAAGLLKYSVAAWLIGELFEKLTGRRGIFDPIDLVLSTVGDFTDEKTSKTQAMTNLASNVLEQVPFLGGLLGGGRVPVSSAIPFGGNINDMAGAFGMFMDPEIAGEKKAETFRKELMNPLWYLLPPAGGGAAKKAVESAEALSQGGEYTYDNDGNKKLKFASDGDVADWVQGVLFGKYATDGGKGYVKGGFKPLSVKQTSAHTNLVSAGMKPERAQEIIQELAAVEGEVDSSGETVEGGKTKNIIAAIDKMKDLNPAQRYGLYYDLLMSDSMRTEMDAATEDFGIAKMTLAEAYKRTYGITGEKGANGKTVPGSKGQKIKEALSTLYVGGTSGEQEARRQYLYEIFGGGKASPKEEITNENTTAISEAAGYKIPNYKAETLEKIASIGVSAEDYAHIDDRIGAQGDKVGYLQSLGFDEKQTRGLVESFVMGKTAKSKMVAAGDMGIGEDVYIGTYIEGYTSKGSKAERNAQIRAYVDSIPGLSQEQRDALYEWNKVSKASAGAGGGSAGRKSSGGRRSGGSGRDKAADATGPVNIPGEAWAKALATMKQNKAPQVSPEKWVDLLNRIKDGGIREAALKEQLAGVENNPILTASQKAAQKAEIRKRYEEKSI